MINQSKLCKLNFQRSTVSWKLFTGQFINVVMTAHAPNIAEYGRVVISTAFTLDSGITQYASTNYLKERSFTWIYYCESIFFYISRGFNFADWLPVDYSRGFFFFGILVLSMFHIFWFFSWFAFKLVVSSTVEIVLNLEQIRTNRNHGFL